MTRHGQQLALVGLALLAARPALADDRTPARRWFPDRPVAWNEHDDVDVPRAPAASHLQDLDQSLLIRDSIANEIDRALALERGRPADDVNALDEVPCSTWFCPRNHVRAMSPDEVAAGPAVASPRLPLRIVKGKDQGATPGFQAIDAAGRKFNVKVDPRAAVGLTSGPEMIGERIFHAAGYNVPGAFIVDFGPDDIVVDARASYRLYGVQPRPLTRDRVLRLLDNAARLPDGRWRAVAVPWIGGRILGGFDMLDRRADDPNDRIAHQHRRSLRASWVLFAWLAELDPSSINSLDSYVEEDGRHFVRHYIIDFGATLGSASTSAKGLAQTGEYMIEVGRTLKAYFSLGLYRRPFQDERAQWKQAVADRPSLGWFPAERFDPDAFRTNRKGPAHIRRTDRDLYWGAKLVTSFSDEQIAAIVATARMSDADSASLTRALRIRRDIIGRRYLRALAAVEAPDVSLDGARVCFDDLALQRGYATPEELRYAVEVSDGMGTRLLSEERAPDSSHSCVPFVGREPGTGYRIVEIRSRFGGTAGRPEAVSKASRVHLRWRAGESRFVVVGLERDE